MTLVLDKASVTLCSVDDSVCLHALHTEKGIEDNLISVETKLVGSIQRTSTSYRIVHHCLSVDSCLDRDECN